MPSFDTVIEPDLVELRNAVEQANKEIGTRFDFKGSSAKIELADRSTKDRELTLFGDNDFQRQQVRDVLLTRLAKRGVDVRFLKLDGKPDKLGGDKLKLAVPVKSGVDAETAKKIQTLLKASKIKVQGAIQGDAAGARDGSTDISRPAPSEGSKSELIAVARIAYSKTTQRTAAVRRRVPDLGSSCFLQAAPRCCLGSGALTFHRW